MNVAFPARNKHFFWSTIIHCDHDHKITNILIAINWRAESTLKSFMPNTNAIHSHVCWLGSHTVLNIIAANKQWKWQTFFANHIQRDATIPPSTICIRHFYVSRFIFCNVRKLINIKSFFFYSTISARFNNKWNIFKLLIGLFNSKHGSVYESIFVFTLRQCKQIIRTFQAFRGNFNIVIHKQNVRKSNIRSQSFHHAASKAASTTNIFIWNNCYTTIRQSLCVQCLTIIHYKHMKLFSYRIIWS